MHFLNYYTAMQFSLHSNWRLSLTALFSILLLSTLDIAIAAPLPQNGVGVKSLAARGPPEGPPKNQITLEEYVAYLRQYYPDTDKYIEYSGNSEDQVKAFQAKNPGYYYYEDFFNAEKSKHYYTAFPEEEDRMDNAEASGEAISTVATKQITVFGAAEWETLGKSSFYTTTEAEANLAAVRSGRLQSINHMAKGATDPSQIMAKEDGNGKMTYQPGYKAGTPNNSGTFGTCNKRDASACDAPSTSESSDSGSSKPYGDTATQETHAGDTATPKDPASPGSESTSDPSETTDPATVDEHPGDVHI